MKRTGIVGFGVCAIAAVSIMGCGSDTQGTDIFAGPYVATTFITTASGAAPRNEIQAGSSMTLILNSNGSTVGHLHIAASGVNPVFDADMAGTWMHSGNTITIAQSADTFVRNMNFTAAIGNTETLVGDQAFSGTRVQLTLTRAPIL
jgi:hypothetical protein